MIWIKVTKPISNNDNPYTMSTSIIYIYIYIAKMEMFPQSARAVKYTDCSSAEGVRPPAHNGCSGYYKQSDGDIPVMLELWRMQSTPYIIAPMSTLAQSGSTW